MNLEQAKQRAEQEFSLYDSLHPEIRKVISEHAVGMYLLTLFRNKPGAYHFALNHPKEFEEALRAHLDKTLELVERLKKEGQT